jgi:hypothetical protein
MNRPEDEAEAERLRLIPVHERRVHVASLRKIAADPNVPEPDRREAEILAKAFERPLRLHPKKKKRK